MRKGITLIELLVAISISVMILGAIYLSLNAALESWHFTRDELALQQVMSDLLEELMEGTDASAGLRSSLEITQASKFQVDLVPPWNELRTAVGGRESFQLTQHIKPGSGLPVCELRLPDSTEFKPLPVDWEDPDNLTERPRVRPAYELVPGSTVRLSYHPDPERAPEAVLSLGWDPRDGKVFRETAMGREILGRNPFGVRVTEFKMSYYDLANQPVSEEAEVPSRDLPMITAVEIELSGQLASHQLDLKGMVMLRNSMRQSGLVILRQGLRIPVPDSRTVHTLFLTNLTGISHEDELQLEIEPKAGPSWRVTLRFERHGQARPVIAQATVEYPPGQPLYTDRPRTSASAGFDFLSLGPAGLYDYDDDPEVEDAVLVEGEPVVLKVTKMDLKGAACFVQP